MSIDINITHRDAAKISGLYSGILTRIIVKSGFKGSLIEMEDLNFHHDSAVMLPDYKAEPPGPGTPDQERITGIKVLAACFCEASQNPKQKILIAGHTDTTGEAGYNVTLSDLRAENVIHALLGNRDGWVGICLKKHKVEDYQQILKWVASRWSWDCDPGSVNNVQNAETTEATRKFQIRYNSEHGDVFPTKGVVEKKTWGAFFTLYMEDLLILLGVDKPGLDALRKDLAFVDTKKMFVGCGENFPIDATRQDNYRSETNRRVEILFFDPGEEPQLKCHPSPGKCSAKECELYNTKIYQFTHIPWKVHLPKPVDVSVQIKEILGLYKPGHNDPADVNSKTTKRSGYLAGYKSDDNKGRIFVNMIPRSSAAVAWDSLWKKNTQYIELKVEVSPSGVSLPNTAAVTWVWFDPDDPFNEDPTVRADAGAILDPNDYSGGSKTGAKGDDNAGVRDFPSAGAGLGADYEEIAPYSMKRVPGTTQCETLIVGGVSKVRLHCTNVGGDNFKISVKAKAHPLVVPKAGDETGVMTMWKRIDVEYLKMVDAYDLPVDQIPATFEKAFVQMDISDVTSTPKKEFLSQKKSDFDKDSEDYVKAPPTGVFVHEKKPGWFLLVSAHEAEKEVGAATEKLLYNGPARVKQYTYSGGDKGEVLVVPARITDKVSHVVFFEASGNPNKPNTHLTTVWAKDIDTDVDVASPGKTTIHIHGLDYQSEFKPGTGLIGDPGQGGAYDRTDNYYPGHKQELPAKTWIAGGLGFPVDVKLRVFSPGSYATSGVSPENVASGKKYFAGRTIIFSKHGVFTKFARTSVTLGGVWATGDTATITVDGTDVDYKVAAGDDLAKIAAQLAKSINNHATVKTKVSSREDGTTVLVSAATRGSAANGLSVTTKKTSSAGTIDSAGPLSGGGKSDNKLLSTAVHELGHAFGFPHKCGYYTYEDPAKKSCAMNYSVTWLYKVGTKDVQRFDTGEEGLNMCALHLDGVRKVHIEDNPAMWTW